MNAGTDFIPIDFKWKWEDVMARQAAVWEDCEFQQQGPEGAVRGAACHTPVVT